jgi:hypothetical protein
VFYMLFRSEQICEQTIRTDNGTYLVNSRCLESHLFAPFSNGESGIRTIAEVSLVLDSITQSEEVIPVGKNTHFVPSVKKFLISKIFVVKIQDNLIKHLTTLKLYFLSDKYFILRFSDLFLSLWWLLGDIYSQSHNKSGAIGAM